MSTRRFFPNCGRELARTPFSPSLPLELNKDPAGIVHCWKETELLRAWEGPVQAEACGTDKKILFPKWQGYYPPTDLEEDLEAGFMGLPFTQPETEHEWEDQVNWDELD